MSKHDRTPDDANEQSEDNQHDPSHQRKQAVHERDRRQCVNCLGQQTHVDKLDADHGVPRGAGGSDQLSNLLSLCRRCHDAKHGNGIAPTVQLQSTGRMTNVEFVWFKQFLQEMLPALARSHDVQLRPKFNLNDEENWYLPLGDLRRLGRQLAEEYDRYDSLQLSQFM